MGWRRDRQSTPVFLGIPVAQLVKKPPVMRETWVRSLGWEDPLEKERLLLQYYDLENAMDFMVHGVSKELDTAERLSPSVRSTGDGLDLLSVSQVGAVLWDQALNIQDLTLFPYIQC